MWFIYLFSQMPLCSWSRRCNCKPLCTPQAFFSEHNHVPKIRLPGAPRHTSWDPRSPSEDRKMRVSSLMHPLIREAALSALCCEPWPLHYLTGVLSSLQIAGTDHVFSDLERICIEAYVIAQERNIHALQLIRIPRWKRQKKKRQKKNL